MRVLYMGTPDFAVPTLQGMIEAGHEVVAVITQPDRPRGRGKKKTAPPVKIAAQALNIPVLQPENVKAPEFIETLKQLAPEIIVVAAYGRILPPAILNLPEYGCINVHASLLPKYRGAAPLHWSVINGEKETGITIMRMDEGMDTGAIILQEAMPILEGDNVGTVHDRMAALGARLLLKALSLTDKGALAGTPQTGEPSYAPMLKAEDEIINWERAAVDLYNQIRGMDPWPGARTTLGGKVLKLWRAEVINEGPVAQLPGQVLATGREGITVATGQGLLLLKDIQLQGARRMSAADFIRGNPINVGTVLGQS
ncbi:MAG: methionyl-tRNA formyltransferase [Peptococcaceae bacterium]|jgi:methionyl-tRNA formyltransferase|nr:methionyl-tRNA formyltransferase [Peptococcaceae bacterium]